MRPCWANHLQGQHECVLQNVKNWLLCSMGELHSNDETGNSDDLHLQKLQLFTWLLLPSCQNSLNWQSHHFDIAVDFAWGEIHQSFLDEKLEVILSLDFLQFTIHNHDSGKSTTQKHDPEILTESCFLFGGNFKLKWKCKIDNKNTTKILTLVSIIEKRDSGQNHNSSRLFTLNWWITTSWKCDLSRDF